MTVISCCMTDTSLFLSRLQSLLSPTRLKIHRDLNNSTFLSHSSAYICMYASIKLHTYKHTQQTNNSFMFSWRRKEVTEIESPSSTVVLNEIIYHGCQGIFHFEKTTSLQLQNCQSELLQCNSYSTLSLYIAMLRSKNSYRENIVSRELGITLFLEYFRL